MRTLSAEHKKNIGLALKGKKRPNFCGEKNPNWKGGAWTRLSPEMRERNNEYVKEYSRRRRKIILQFYGGNPPKCKCCGESIIQFLCIDHINGGGSKHRKEMGQSGSNLYRWIVKNDFPKGFQVLCNNCNMAKGFYGECPHGVLEG